MMNKERLSRGSWIRGSEAEREKERHLEDNCHSFFSSAVGFSWSRCEVSWQSKETASFSHLCLWCNHTTSSFSLVPVSHSQACIKWVITNHTWIQENTLFRGITYDLCLIVLRIFVERYTFTLLYFLSFFQESNFSRSRLLFHSLFRPHKRVSLFTSCVRDFQSFFRNSRVQLEGRDQISIPGCIRFSSKDFGEALLCPFFTCQERQSEVRNQRRKGLNSLLCDSSLGRNFTCSANSLE